MSSNLFGNDTNPGLLVHEWTKNFRGGVKSPSAGVGREGRGACEWAERLCDPTQPSAPLDRTAAHGAEAGRSCLETLAGRRSVRQYADAALPLAQLARLLELCHAQGAGESLPRPLCKLFPLVWNVAGLAAGSYLYDEHGHGLRLVKSCDPLPMIKEFCFQAEFTHAPALILIAGSLSEALELHGERGYRRLLMAAGTLIQRLYLAASYLGLAGCVTGSVVPEQFGRRLGMDGFHAAVLMAFAVGLPETAGGAYD